MTWLVAVCILPDEAAGVSVDLARSSGQTEVFVKFLQKCLLASEKVNQTLRILWHEPHILPANEEIWIVRAAFAALMKPELAEVWNRAAEAMERCAEAIRRSDAEQQPVSL